jgi:uncharacterized protein (TIGR02453 family)
MGLIRPFPGFPPEALEFLAGLAANNHRQWFEQRREQYLEFLLQPAQAFVDALGDRLQRTFPGLDFDPTANGSGSLTRIYRDVRFSKDKSPYKNWLGMRFWESHFNKKEGPRFFLVLRPSGLGFFTGVWQFDQAELKLWRETIDSDVRGPELVALARQLETAGLPPLGGLHYKRVPRGYSKDHGRQRWLRHNGLTLTLPTLPPERLGDGDLVEICAQKLEPSLPLHSFLAEFCASAKGKFPVDDAHQS